MPELVPLALATLILLYFIYKLLQPNEFHPLVSRIFNLSPPKYSIEGRTLPEFDEVRQVFNSHFEDGLEVGGSFVVYSYDKLTVELYGGYQDYEKNIIYDNNTLNLVFSSSKFMESVAIAYLVDQKLLNYDDKVTKYWPEFGAGNKSEVTLADVLRHEGGVPYFDNPQPNVDTIYNTEKLNKVIENQNHIFNGKPERAYHALTRGFLLNEIVKRVDSSNRSIGKLFKEVINPELDIEFYLGLDISNISLKERRAVWYKYPLLDLFLVAILPTYFSTIGKYKKGPDDFRKEFFDKNSHPRKSFALKISNSFKYPNTDDYIDIEIPSANGFTSAKSLAKMANFMANLGNISGSYPIISKSTIEASIEKPTKAFDHIFGHENFFTQGGFGVFYFEDVVDYDNQGNKFIVPMYGWGGFGGSMVLFNPSYKFAMSYVMNASHLVMLGEGRARRLLVKAFKSHLKLSKDNNIDNL